jgi:hypothetical protein
MFRCAITKQVSEVGEKPVFVVTEKRFKEYLGYPRREGKKGFYQSTEQVKISEGWEIVKVIKVRKSTLERLEKEGKAIEERWVD